MDGIEHVGVYDKEEIIENCTVQILTNTVTGEQSVGWWRGKKEDVPRFDGVKEPETGKPEPPDLDSMPCAGFLEDLVREIAENDPDPKSIGVCVCLTNGKVLTGYYHANITDKALFAHHIQSDAFFDEIEANAGRLADLIDDVADGESDIDEEEEEGEE